MTVVEISRNSEAGRELARILSDVDTYKMSVDVRANGVALKQNERMWTATLSTVGDDCDCGMGPGYHTGDCAIHKK